MNDLIESAISVIERYIKCRHLATSCFMDCSMCPYRYETDELTYSLELVVRYLKDHM